MARTTTTHDSPARSPSPRSMLLRKRWLVLLGLVALVWFAPQLVAMTPLLQVVVDRAVPELKGAVSVRGASLGWVSPVELRNITWRDADGRTLAEVPAVRIERTLSQLATNASNLGTIRILQPRVAIALRDDGSNLEDAIAPWLEAPASGSSLALTLQVEDGAVEIADTTRQLAWQLQKVNASVVLPATPDMPSQLQMAGEVHDTHGTPRPLEAAYEWHTPRAQPQAGEPGGTLSLKTTATPLAMLRPLVRRFVAEADLEGAASCEAQWIYNADFSQQSLKVAKLSGEDLRFAAPQWLGSDTLRSAKLNASGDIELARGRMKFTNVELASDFAQLTAAGQLPLGGWSDVSATALAALQNEDYTVRGELDLAKIAAQLPQTLRIREGTEITSGVVTLALASHTAGKKRRWDGELKSSPLAALQNGREIAWDEPISITLAAQQSAAGPVIERLSCAASFLSLSARGTLESGELTASGDLSQLLDELNRFVDLDDVRLAGELKGDMSWQREGEEDFRAQGDAEVTNFELTLPGQQPWRESQLNCDLAAAGRGDARGLRQLDGMQLRLVAGADQLQAELSQPIADPLNNSVWPLDIVASGELSRWLPRVQHWLPVTVQQATGDAKIKTKLISSPESLTVRDAKIDVANLQLQLLGITIRESESHFSGDATYSYREGRVESESLVAATSAVALRADKLTIEPRSGALAISGDVGYRADLERLSGWFDTPGTQPTRKWSGMTDGRLKFTHQANVTHAKWTAEVENAALAQRAGSNAGLVPIAPVANVSQGWTTVWQEPKLAWHGQGEFDHVRDRLVATHLNVTSDMVNVVARGQIDALTTKPVVDLSGEIAYDLKNVAAILAAYLGESLQISGADKRQFLLRGPLPTLVTSASQDPRAPATQKWVWPKELVGRAGVGWNSAEIYGLPVGEASIDAALENGIVSFAAIDVPVADGRVKAWPRLVLANDPMVFQLAKGTQVDQVQITPQMCRTWLKYVAPLLADATRAEGKLSLNVEGATFPVMTPEAGAARGTMTVHGGRVGPGPLAEQYVLLATQVRSLLERKPLDPNFRADSVQWLTLPQQDVQVELNNGRVYHRGLQIMVGDTTLITTGSVGTDQTLGLIVEVPIRDQWVAKDRVLSSLRGQSVKVPINGTVSKPQLDARALDQLAGQLLQNAAGNLIENKLQEGLDKLFKPK